MGIVSIAAIFLPCGLPLHRLSLTAKSVLAVDLKKPKVSHVGHFECDLLIN